MSGIVVPPAGWDIDVVTVYYEKARKPAEWLRVATARFNVFRKSANLPLSRDDPRKGRMVDVKVKPEKEGIYAVRAEGLGLHLDAGEYWIGLTPIVSLEVNGEAGHLRTQGHCGEGIEPAVRCPEGEGGPSDFLKAWTTMHDGYLAPFDEEITIKIEGRRRARGEQITTIAEATANERKVLRLRFAEFDPLARQPAIQPDLMASKQTRIFVVQLKSTPDQVAREQLTRSGLFLLRYLPDDAYIVEMDPKKRKVVAELACVRWVGPYHPAYRIDPSLHDGGSEARGSPAITSRQRDCYIQVFLRGLPQQKEVATQIERAGGVVQDVTPGGYRVVAGLNRDQVRAVARLDEVLSVELVEKRWTTAGAQGVVRAVERGFPSIAMSDVRALGGADFVEAAGEYRGQGVHCSIIDGDVRPDHVDLASRPILFAGPRMETPSFHGTAVTGVLFGNGTGDPRARGLLPEGQPIFSSSMFSWADRYALTRTVVSAPYFAVFQSDSTGGSFSESYHYADMELDDIVLEHDLLICKALGNAGLRQASPGSWAKNIVSVGGVAHRGTAGRGDDTWARAASFGPSDDGRIKPDFAHFIDGVLCTDAASRTSHAPFRGTSCATPLIAGHFGLMLQIWADGIFGNWPRGKTVFERRPHTATAKALMINSANPYDFSGSDAELGRCRQGWGLPDLRRLYELRRKMFIIDQEIALQDHRAVAYSLEVARGEPALRATLVYTDLPGATCATHYLVNDLDLKVISPDGTIYHGNHGLESGNWSKPGGTRDSVNNVESVFVNQPSEGTWTVQVSAARIALDQHAETQEFDNDFALVVSGVNPIDSRTEQPDRK